MKSITQALFLAAALTVAVVAVPASAQPFDDDDIQQTVARISYISGSVSFNRGDNPDDWHLAARNYPLTLGDRIYAGRDGRAELQTGAAVVNLAPRTELAALNLTYDVKQFSLAAGTAAFRIRGLDRDEVFEVDTPNAAITFDRAGQYRVDVDEDGNTRVGVTQGLALVAAGGGEVQVRRGEEMSVTGLDRPYYDVYRLGRPDAFDNWVEVRSRRIREGRSSAYVSSWVEGYEDLDEYGRWDNVPGYGNCWTPASVEAGWAPYRYGNWIWQDPWGWSWVGYEPWGWTPYHYGRWVNASSRWYWVPSGPTVRARYSPALVAFVGGGPSFSVGGGSFSFSLSVGGGGGYVGWIPLAPRDTFVPWWGSRRRQTSYATNVSFTNRRYVTVVNQTAFLGAQPVYRNVVTSGSVLQQVERAPIVSGPVPVMPTRSSLRVSSVSGAPLVRPPSQVVSRPVVTRVAPPPVPPRFETKLQEIRENRGAPLAPVDSARLSVETHRGARAVTPVRPVVTEPGRMVLAPREGRGGDIAPAPVREAPRNKALATADRPLVNAPNAASQEAPPPPARVAPGAVVEAPPPGQERRQEREGDRPGVGHREPPGQIRRAEPSAPADRQEEPPSRRFERPQEQAPPETREERRREPPGQERRREALPPPGVDLPPDRRPNEPPHPTPPPQQAPSEVREEPREERRVPPGWERRRERPAPPEAERPAPQPPPAEVRQAPPPQAPPPQAQQPEAPQPAPRVRGPRRVMAPADQAPPSQAAPPPPQPQQGQPAAAPPASQEKRDEPKQRGRGRDKDKEKDKDKDKDKDEEKKI